MSFRTNLLAVADAARALSGPSVLDIRTNQLTIRNRTWDGPYIREGAYTDSDLVLPAQYPIRRVSSEEIDASGGSYFTADLIVNHITPYDGVSVGYTPQQLDPKITDEHVETLYIITGPQSGTYTLVDSRFEHPFSYQLVIRRQLQ